MLLSVLMSSPGPLIVGLGLLSGKSSTQLADFIRRSIELLALIVAFVIYQVTNKNGVCDEAKKSRLERICNIFVGFSMCFCGIIMTVLAFLSDKQETGNVIPGLIVALLGVVANTLFFFKYTKLNRETPNSILAVQARLYGAKSLVDCCVTLALATVALFPTSSITPYVDLVGSVIVALYLCWCGVKTLLEKLKKSVPSQGENHEV